MGRTLLVSIAVGILAVVLTFTVMSLWSRFHGGTQGDSSPNYDLWLAIFTGVTAAVGLIQIGFLLSADDTARRSADAATLAAQVARDTLVATQRPWLSVEVALTGAGLVYDGNGDGHIDVAFSVKNTGPSPALNTHIDAKFVPFMTATGRTGVDDLRDTCVAAKRAPAGNGLLGQTVFPQQLYSEVPNLLITKTLFQGAMEPVVAAKDVTNFVATLVGCVSYRSSVDDQWHITPFYADMRQVNPANPKLPDSIEWSRGNQPVSALVLQRSFVSLPAD